MGMNRFDCVLRNAILLDGTGAAPDASYGDEPGHFIEGGHFIVASGTSDAEFRSSRDQKNSRDKNAGEASFTSEVAYVNFASPRFPAEPKSAFSSHPETSFPAIPPRASHRTSRGVASAARQSAVAVEPMILNNGARLGAGGDGSARDSSRAFRTETAIAGSELRAELASAEARRAARDAAERGRPRAPVRARVFGMGPIDSFAGADHGMHSARGPGPRAPSLLP